MNRSKMSALAGDELTSKQRTTLAIAAATAVNLPFGTIYAFSVFLKPMEAMLAIGRTQMAFVFSLATICLTMGMVLSPGLYRRVAAIPLLLGAGLVSACGLLLAASANGLIQLALGYGVLFGLGGGVTFVLVQQGVNQAAVTASGLVNGYVVSLYPLGAMIGAPLFGWFIAVQGLRATLVALAATIMVCAVIAAYLFHRGGVRMQDHTASASDTDARHWSIFLRLFAVFFLAAAAGLMVMSQAAGIVQAYGGQTAYALGATTFITGAIAAARISGGWLVDRFVMPQVAAGAHLLSLAGSLLLLLWPSPVTAVPALAMIGVGYGVISGSTAGAIGQYWHKNAFGRVAGQMYIAWCVAAISLPVLAGWLYDRTQAYGTAMMLAAAVNVLGALLATTLPRHGRPRD